MRTLGFAASPGLLRILGVVPLIGRLLVVVTVVWMLMTMVVAVRQALDFRSTPRAILVCFLHILRVGWL